MYKTFFENNLMPCAILDSNFNFVRVNTAYARAGNRSPAKLIGKNISDLYPSDIKEIFKQVVATKTSYRTQTRPFESPYNKGQGLTYWDWSIEPVLDDDQEVAYLIFMLYEVTKRVKAARELDNFFNLSVDLLGMIDFQGKLIKINTYFAKILGYLEKELVNRSLFSLIHEDDRVKMEEDFNNAVSTNQPIVNLENRCRLDNAGNP
jgi:PAS domain S-box-containing protein